MAPMNSKDIDFGGPASYRIVVQGIVGGNWTDRLAGMVISHVPRENKAQHTHLVGRIRDQAELQGVLDTLYGLHLSILRVEKLED